MENKTKSIRSRADLVARYNHLSYLMRDERMSEREYQPLVNERSKVQAEIDAIDAKAVQS